MTDQVTKPDAAEIILPDKFTLELQRFSTGMWIVTTDAHKGYMHTVPSQHKNLAEGLAEVPGTLAAFLEFVRKHK
jgi:hypothetical protein